MNAGPDYNGAFRRHMKVNVDNVLPALDKKEGWLLKKIANAAERYCITEEKISDALRECDVLRYYFAIDPTRQSLHENEAAKFIIDISGVEKFQQIRGESKYIADGRVVDVHELKRLRRAAAGLPHTKGIDFSWYFNGRQFYAYHKHTEQMGGAQDNQGNDVKNFLREAVKNDMPQCVFIALCDGAFYRGKNGVAGKSKMDAMKDITQSAEHKNVFVMTTAELPEFLAA